MRRVLSALALLTALPSGFWRPGDRVLLSDFSVITAVAASPFMVYAATQNGLLIYDRGGDHWVLPQTFLDGFPTAPVRLAIADPVGNGVWLGTADGWAHYSQDLNQWDGGIVPGGVRDAFLDSQDPTSGLYVLGATGWGLIPRGGLIATPVRMLPPASRRVGPLALGAALARAPVVSAMRARLLTDSRLRIYQFTAAAQSPDRPDELFLGTTGMGLLRVNAASGEGGPLPFGLPNTGATVVAAGPGGVWTVGSAHAGERRGVTWVSDDLSRFTLDENALGRGTSVLLARRLLYADQTLWLATDHGVYQIPTGGESTGRVLDLGAGLPGENVLSLARAPDGVWVGTTQGLAVITNAGAVVRMPGYDRPVAAMVAQRESIWVGTADGLGLIEPGAQSPTVPPALAAQPSLRSPITAVTNVHDTIVAATADQLGWRDPATGSWTVLRPRAPVGTIAALAPDAGGVWIGGTSGVVFWDIGRQTFHGLSVPGDIPAAIRDLTVEGDYLWVASDAGLLRFSRDAALHR